MQKEPFDRLGAIILDWLDRDGCHDVVATGQVHDLLLQQLTRGLLRGQGARSDRLRRRAQDAAVGGAHV